MENELPKHWKKNLEILDVAFQPILNIHTGEIFGVEALLRNYDDIGYESIFALLDHVYEEGLLYSFDIALREKALLKFSSIEKFDNLKLFYNLDNRLLEMPNFKHGNTNKLLQKLGVKKEDICFEISERHQISSNFDLTRILDHYQQDDFCIAIDDFGVGFSGYKLLYDSTPNVIKIDRFFLQNINNNPKKKLLVRNITHLATQLGIKVVAEGLETPQELLTCKDIGCHFVQGYLIQKPTRNVNHILRTYPHIVDIIKSAKRKNHSDAKFENYIDKIAPLDVKTNMDLVIQYFKKNIDIDTIPIVNCNNEPIGILSENQIKKFVYSPHGMSLLLNDKQNTKLKNLIQNCSNTDINSDISTIIELFSNNADSVGIIITKNAQYYGFLSARAIIEIMNEENLTLARDQNPLTKLPGNNLIEKYITNCIHKNTPYILCYFDLDNFKVFNDIYGFRNGDRVIQLFADILKKHLSKEMFVAHIGGDDFFCATEYNANLMFFIEKILEVIEKFTANVKEFYTQKDKDNGYVIANDRDGIKKVFPLLTVSASTLIIDQKTQQKSLDNVNHILSLQKKIAKNERHHIAVSSLL